MYIQGIGTASPTNRFTKTQCLEAFRQSEWFSRLGVRARYVAETVLVRDNGIEARRLVIDDLSEAFEINPDTLSDRFSEHAPRLAAEAAAQALLRSDIRAPAVDAVIVSTCTGYLCPGLSGYVVELLNLRSDVQAFDLVGQGCAAALPNLMLGRALLASHAAAHVLSICVEVSSAAMYLDDDPGVIVSACLFGDGAGAAILSRESNGALRHVQWRDSASLIDPARRDALRFEHRNGMLRNILTRAVPDLAAINACRVLDKILTRAQLDRSQINTWVMHAGGRDVLIALQKHLSLSADRFSHSAAILKEYGNLSSAFVYFVLDAALSSHAPGGWWWLSSFGAGFSCHGALLEVH